MKLETKRLIIREMDNNDFESVKRYLSDRETMKYYPNPYDDKGVQKWIDWSMTNYQTLGFGLFALILKETNEMIGDCGITMQIINHKIKPELGYHIYKDYWRKGYGKEASKAIIDWCFKNTPFEKLYSYMEKENVASYSLAIANGMKKEEEYVDESGSTLLVYYITRKEWSNNH